MKTTLKAISLYQSMTILLMAISTLSVSPVFGQAKDKGNVLSKGNVMHAMVNTDNGSDYMTSPNGNWKLDYGGGNKGWTLNEKSFGSWMQKEELPFSQFKVGKFGDFLIMQEDGNLVYYTNEGTQSENAIFATGTNEKGGNTFELNDNGTVVIKNSSGHAVWGPWPSR